MCGFAGYIACVSDDRRIGARTIVGRGAKALQNIAVGQMPKVNGRISTSGLGIAGYQLWIPLRVATSRWNMAILSLPLTG